MRFPSKLSPDEWAEVRRLRALGTSFADLSRHFGMKAQSISSRARREGWANPSEPEPRAGGGQRSRSRSASPATADVRRRLALRLYRVIEFSISMMELGMQKRLETFTQDPDAEAPAVTRSESDSFAALIQQINQVTEMASEPATADGRRKSATNPELTALSDEIDADGLAVASEKDENRARLAQQLAKAVGRT
jgi:hypothetical protein